MPTCVIMMTSQGDAAMKEGRFSKPYQGSHNPPFNELNGTATPPAWVLPPGWQASWFNMLPGGGQLEYLLKDTVLANAYYQQEYEDRSTVWPTAYQNEGSFKPYYHKLRRETKASDSHAPHRTPPVHFAFG